MWLQHDVDMAMAATDQPESREWTMKQVGGLVDVPERVA
jgi:hypothetical protein